MKLSNLWGLFSDLFAGIRFGLLPTLKDIIAQPSLLLHPHELQHIFFAHIWVTFSATVDEGGRPVKEQLLPQAYGAVLDIGAGHGHSLKYLDRKRVTTYIALEPNALMHDNLRATANAAGYSEADGSLRILGCGAQDIPPDVHADTLLSILVLCTIPEPRQVLSRLVKDVLVPGGTLLFYEHVLNPHADVAWWQRFLAPLWASVFDGCRIDRPTPEWIVLASDWESTDMWGKEGEDTESLFWHQAGRFVKRV